MQEGGDFFREIRRDRNAMLFREEWWFRMPTGSRRNCQEYKARFNRAQKKKEKQEVGGVGKAI